jgi:hypothetical protein
VCEEVFTADFICPGCYLDHEQEGNELIEKRMILGEVLGADCAGVVAGYMLYFFAGWRGGVTKNEMPLHVVI